MALAFADRVKETTTTTGTGTITLAGASAGYQSFAAIGNGNTTYYTIVMGAQWEVGVGTYTAAGTTLSRDTVLASSNAGALVNFSAGTKDVFCDYPAGKAVIQDSSGNVGIGTSAPGVKLDVIGTVRSTGFVANGTTAYSPQSVMVNWSADATGGYYIFYKGRAGGTTSQNGDTLGTLLWYGYDTANTSVATSSILTVQTAAAGAGSAPTALIFANGGNVERMRVTAAGLVGIGTSNPASLLDVNGLLTSGNITVRGDGVEGGQITFNNLGNTAGPLTLDVEGSGNGRLFTTVNNANLTLGQLVGTGGFVNIATSSVERLRIDSGGNVNIGAQGATAAGGIRYFDIYNTENTNGASATDIRLITQNAAGSGTTTVDLIKYKSGAFYIANAETGSGGIIGFSTSSTERMRITAAGLVGIGTSTPSFLLHGVQNGNAEFRVSATNVGTNSAGLTVENEGNRNWNLWANRSTDNFIIGANSRANDFIAINGSTGNVGIGTTSPATSLDVSGTIRVGAGSTDPGTGGVMYLVGSGAFQTVIGGAAFAVHTGANNARVERARITSDGSMQLSVGGVSNTHQFLYNESGAEIQLSDATGNGPILIDNSGGLARFYKVGSGAISMGTTGANYFQFITSSIERMRIDSSGNVGIGTTAPASLLHVDGGVTTIQRYGSSGALVLRSAAGTQASPTAIAASTVLGITVARGYDGAAYRDVGNIAFVSDGAISPTSSPGYIQFNTTPSGSVSGLERMRIDSSGNVGIGTSAPSSYGRLSVSGNVVLGPLTRNQATTLSVGVYTTGDPADDARANIGFTTVAGGASSSSFITFATNNYGVSGGERMRITAAGNVGIGTTNPTERLDTGSGNTRTQALVISGDQHLFYGASSTEFGFRVGAGGPFYGIGTTGSNNMRINSSSGGDMLFAIGGTEYMRISNTTGNVRIGSGATNVSALSISRSSATATVAASSSIVLSNRNTSINGTIAGGIFVDTYRDVRDPHYSGGIWFTRNQEVSNLSSSSAIVFGTMVSWDSGLPTERMRLDSAGNLSIGNTSGNARLRVASGGQVNAPVLGNVGNYPIFISNADVGYGLGIGTNGSDGHVWLQAQRSDSAVAYNITLNEAGGNVGIGTSSPSARLDVRSGAGADSQIANRAGNAAYMVLQGTSFPNFNQVQSFDGSGNLYWSIGGSGTANTLAFLTNGSNERARINEFGQFLIGTTSGGRTVCINAADNWIRQSNPSRSWLIGPANGSDYNIYDETAGTNRFRIDTSGTWNGPNSIILGSGQNLDNKIEVGSGRTGNNFAYIDLIGDTTYTDFGLRLLRGNGGPNTFSQLSHRGTGDFSIVNVEGAALTFGTSNSERFRVEATGAVSFSANSLIVGRNSASTDVNSANDTGSISIRGSTTTVAVMSFHRAGAYAMNVGLGLDAVFRMGGWSMSSNCFQMDGSGNLTMLGNVTAYSDARIKKDVETIDDALGLVRRMRGVRFTRTDTEKRGIGVIAQEMLEVIPEVVQQGMGEDTTLSVAYGNLVGVLIEAIKELEARVAELEGK